jgi:alkanesulfonate monooxygenase SsuD/methylene tetrahydromethanopterin reductase-like flavin-dependent oxidoreductase (luciferase family)
MLDLVARYGDAWNASWYGHPDGAVELRARVRRLHHALDAVGRPRDSIELTAGIFVATAPGNDDRPREAISGSIDEIAESLAGYASLGISHLIAHVWPRTSAAVRELGRAAALARSRRADVAWATPVAVSSR